MTENLPAQRPAARPPVRVDLSKPLTDLDEAMRLSEALSLSTLVPDALRGKPASILHILLTGQALDLHWTESIRVIYSPGNGQIGMRAQFLLSQLRKKGHKYSGEYSGDGESYTFTLTRKDEPDNPYSATFSRQDAIDARLTSKDNWTRYFRRMLRARAITDCVGFAAPEVLLGFVVEGDEPEAQPVQLQPSSPAPPEPAGEAAPGGQAAQAEQLRKLDARMREEAAYPQEQSVSDPEGTVPQDFLESPAMGGNLPVATMVSEREAGLPQMNVATEAALPTVADAEAPTVPSASASPEEEPEGEAQDFTGGATPASGSPSGGPGTAPPPPQGPVADDLVEQFSDPEITGTDAASKAKTVVLSEWFTKCGYDPKQYRAQVLHACSVYVKRRITGVRGLSATEVMHLTNELSGIFRRTDELAPVSRLADEVSKWENAWRGTDPEGFAAYEEGQ